MTYDQWLEKYKPVKNHIDTNASMDGYAFETFGEEVEFVHSHKNEFIWTIVDCDGRSFLTQGSHYVNRMNYMVSSVRADPEDGFADIDLDEDD